MSQVPLHKRYILEVDLYLYAQNDVNAEALAEIIIYDLEHRNAYAHDVAQKGLYEAPKGSFKVRKV